MALPPGARVGVYEVVAQIGEGGMGQVYRATDTRLKRQVAIKILPPSLAADVDRLARFQREAEVLASMNHPNIAAIYGLEESGGITALVMELVEGDDLSQIIARHGPAAPAAGEGAGAARGGGTPPAMSIVEALRIARQIAEALEAAHGQGTIHRDLKPANIKVRADGTVKVLDFGLAKALNPPSPEATAGKPSDPGPTRTQSGMILGTAAYMSPEQAQAKPLDERSDIFSFGAVMYELLSGQRPFTGTSIAEVLSSVLRDEPAPLNASEAVRAIVSRSMAKRAADRFASMTEVKAALDQISRGTPMPRSQPSIAVLPFANMSGDKEQEYFSDGLAEEIINVLVKIPGLKVIARTSAFAFKGQNTDIRKIAEILGVTHVLEGSVRRAGSRIRVTAQLITATDGTHLWSERYDRQMEDLFAMQDEIAVAIASELKLKFAPSPAAPPRRQPNLKAYEAYLRYLHYQWGFTEESLRRSRECLEQAMALDPEFALPYAGLADHHLASTVANVRADEAMPRARELAGKALTLDPDLPEAHGLLGIVAGPYERDWREAERRFGLAMAREPVPWHVRQWHAYFFLFPVGRCEEARREARRAIEDDPLSQVNYQCLGAICEGLGLEEAARAAYTKALELDPRFWWGWSRLGLHHALCGRRDDARACSQKANAIFPSDPTNIGLLAGLLRSAGESQQAEALLSQFPNGSYGSPVALTCFHLVCGEVDQAVEWAGRALDERHPVFMSDLIRPFERVFRTSPGWPAVLKKMFPQVP